MTALDTDSVLNPDRPERSPRSPAFLALGGGIGPGDDVRDSEEGPLSALLDVGSALFDRATELSKLGDPEGRGLGAVFCSGELPGVGRSSIGAPLGGGGFELTGPPSGGGGTSLPWVSSDAPSEVIQSR